MRGEQRLGQLGLALRLRGAFGIARCLRSQLGLTHLLFGLARRHAASARFIHGHAFGVLLLDGGIGGRSAKFCQHGLFDGVGVIAAFQNVGTAKEGHSCSWKNPVRGYMACHGAIHNDEPLESNDLRHAEATSARVRGVYTQLTEVTA